LGLKCLGLFALIDKETAKAALGTFYKEMKSCGEQVRIISTKAIVDILSTYGVSIIGSQGLFHYARLLYKSLNTFEMPKLQCIVAEGLCKLFLADIFNGPSDNFDDKEAEFESEKQLFESLILCYFNPLTKKNPELSQILAFCLPVYAFSHVNHQFRIASVSGDCVYRMFSQENALVRGNTKLTPNTVVQQLIHWCDPNNLINLNQVQIKRQTSHVWQSVYFLQAIEQGTPKAVKKAIINNLNKLSISEEIESKVLNGLVDAIKGTQECLELNSHEPEFTFDKLTMKNFDNFVVHIKEKSEQALEREKKEACSGSVSSSRVPSRSNSILGDMDIRDVDMDDVDELSNSTCIKEEHGSENETQDKTEEDKIEEDKIEEDKIEEDKQREINDTLEKIDQILAEEDKIEYDISMED
jgi:condensin complex subunit 3